MKKEVLVTIGFLAFFLVVIGLILVVAPPNKEAKLSPESQQIQGQEPSRINTQIRNYRTIGPNGKITSASNNKINNNQGDISYKEPLRKEFTGDIQDPCFGEICPPRTNPCKNVVCGQNEICVDGTCRTFESECSDQIDNDNDGKIDLADTDCNAQCVCWSRSTSNYIYCTNAENNDFCDSDITNPNVGFLKDSYKENQALQTCSSEETSCSDGFDNDCDGLTDCADPSCLLNGCTIQQWGNTCGTFIAGIDYGIYEQSCTDNIDNDGDGNIDCLDTDCIYGADCSALTVQDCNCPDLNNNGEIYQDWEDLALALNTEDYEKVYKCVQVYNPYCTDLETKDFLDWMKNKEYYGRVINIYAEAANDQLKRYDGNNANMQRYYDIKSGVFSVPSALRFKSDLPYAIHFKEIEASDSNIVNNLNSEQEVQTFLKPFMEQIYSKSISFYYDITQINYVNSFGPYSPDNLPCPNTGGNDVCFQTTNIRNWALGNFNLSQDNIGHWGADYLTSGEDVYMPMVNNMNGIVYQNHMKVTEPNFLTIYAHEWGHYLSLPHPLTTAPYLGGGKDVVNLIGTCGVMGLAGYVYGCVNMLDPLARYALEPINGYDNPLYGQNYSEQILSC